MTLKERFYRWRASRGYGVHSPLAYRLVRNVVRPEAGVVYYGEERLQLVEGASPLQIRRARLLLRFVAELQPSFVWIAPRLPEIYREAIMMAGSVVRIFDADAYPRMPDRCEMAITEGNAIKAKELRMALEPGRSLIAFDIKPSAAAAIRKALPGGVLLDGAGSLMAVSTADGAVHRYDVSRF